MHGMLHSLSSTRLHVCANVQVQDVDAPAPASFRAFHQEAVAADVKETLCRVSEACFEPEENANIPNVSYEVCGRGGRGRSGMGHAHEHALRGGTLLLHPR